MSASVLLIGTTHMDGDESWLEPDRQREIADVVDRVCVFAPTVVAVECLPKQQPDLQRRYEAWRRGEGQLGTNEIDQLGFRVAARSDVNRIEGFDADWQLDWGGLQELYGTEDEIAQRFGAVIEEVAGAVQATARRLLDTSFREALLYMNSAEYLSADHRMYLRIAELGADTNHGGALYAASWYRRNIRMYANLCRLARTGAERIFALVGVGHVAIIRDLIIQSGRLGWTEPASVLC